MTSNRKYLLLLLLVFLFPVSSHAEILATQPNATTTGGTITGTVGASSFQTLGTFPSAVGETFYGVIFQIKYDGSGTAPQMSAWIRCYDESTYTNGCSSGTSVGNGSGSLLYYSSTSTLVSGTQYYQFLFASSTYKIATGKYYRIGLVSNTAVGSPVTSIGGVSVDNYSAGSCSAGSYCTGLADAYFLLVGSGNTHATSISSIVQPIANSVTSSTNVTFIFNYYYNNAVDSYDKVGFTLKDVTSGQDLSAGTEQTPIGGNSTFSSINANLQSTHQYIWTPYLRSSAATSTAVYGTPTTFYVIANPYATTTQATASSTVNGLGYTNVSSSNGTTTINFDNHASILQTLNNITGTDVLCTKFPFSYMCDLNVLFTDLAQGSPQANARYTLPLGAVYTNPATGIATTTIAMIDPVAISATGYLSQIRTIVGYGLYLMTGIYTVSTVLSAF